MKHGILNNLLIALMSAMSLFGCAQFESARDISTALTLTSENNTRSIVAGTQTFKISRAGSLHLRGHQTLASYQAIQLSLGNGRSAKKIDFTLFSLALSADRGCDLGYKASASFASTSHVTYSHYWPNDTLPGKDVDITIIWHEQNIELTLNGVAKSFTVFEAPSLLELTIKGGNFVVET